MARRHLSPDEQALWSALTRSVRPIRPVPPRPPAPLPVRSVDVPDKTELMPASLRIAPNPPARTPATVLDSGWERQIRRGTLSPDMSIDLHGHSLSAAHARLDRAIGTALAQDVRVLLVVTGKPPKNLASGGSAHRGAIRHEIGHWLETSRYSDRIASVRVAHPRHGGDGAIYLILRRKK